MKFLKWLLIFSIICSNLDISTAQVISYFKMGPELCSTKCRSGYLKVFDTCIFNFEIRFNETLPDLTLVNIEVKEASGGIYRPLYSLDLKYECDGYKENAQVYCTELDKNLFSIAIKADELSRYSEANVRVYITTPNVPKVFSDILKFPKYYDTREAMGHLKINGRSFHDGTFCNTTTNDKELKLEFDCNSEASPCLIQIKKNGEIVEETENTVVWEDTFESSTAVNISIRYSACRLDGEYKQFNCVYKPELLSTDDSFQTSLILGISISIGAIIILTGIFLIFRFKCRKQELHKRNLGLSEIEQGGTTQLRTSEEQRTSDQVNLTEIKGWTALMLASANGCTEVVKQLVEAGANIDAQNKNGWTALMFAARNGNSDIVKYLISQNADVNIKECHGWSALTVGAKKGRKEIVRAISEKSQAGCIKVIKEKIRDRKKYKRFDKLNRNSKSVFEMDLNELVEETTPLLNQNDIAETETPNEGNGTNTDVNTTCEIETEMTKKKVPGGATISHVKKGSYKDVINAARKGNKKNFPFLLSQRVNLDDKTGDGLTPLMVISQEGNAEGVKLLLAYGANINIVTDDKGLTALMFACYEGHTKTANVLIEEDANVKIQDKQGWTALMHAVKHEHNEIASLLIKRTTVQTDRNIQKLKETNEENDSVFENDPNFNVKSDTFYQKSVLHEQNEAARTETEGKGNVIKLGHTIDATSNEDSLRIKCKVVKEEVRIETLKETNEEEISEFKNDANLVVNNNTTPNKS